MRTTILSQCRVRHCYACMQMRENVTCEGVLLTPPRRLQQIAISCKRSDYNKFFQKKNCSAIKFSDMSNICFIVRSIIHIKECLLLSCVACFEDWSWIFRTRSFTLRKNDLDFNDMPDSATVSESISSSSTKNLSVCCMNKPDGCSQTGLPVLTSINSSDFHSWQDHFSSAFLSEYLDEQASKTGLPVLWCCSFHELRSSWLSLFMSSTSVHSTATMRYWMKRTTNATFGIDKEELVQVALLQIHGAYLLVLLESLIGVSSVHFCLVCLVWFSSFLVSLELLRWWAIGMVFLLICPSRCTSPQSANFWVANHDMWISLEAIVNSFKFLFETSLSSIVGYEMLFLCFGFNVPSTSTSPLGNNVVLHWESIQSPWVKILAGFTFFQEMSTSAIDNSLIPIKKAFWALHFWNCFASPGQLYIAHFTNHRFQFVTGWVVGVILLQIGLKCLSMRMTLDLLHEFANTEVFCLFHNCMWQSRHSEVDVYFLALCEQTDGLFRVSPFLNDLRLRFRLRLCLDLNVQNTLAHNWKTGLPVLSLVLSQPSKKRLPISWALEPDGCSDQTSLPVLTIGFLVFGWVCWESLPPPATSEPNSFIQLYSKEIFGGSRGDAYTSRKWFLQFPSW